MSQDYPTTPAASGIVIRPSTGLASLPKCGSPALSEIISRSLAHIQESKALATLHRIGECELYGPDYRLVCAWAEELQMDPNTVLEKLLWCRNPIYKRGAVDDYDHPYIWFKEDGRFEHLEFPPSDYFPDLHFPRIKGLKLESLDWSGKEPLDLDLFPELNHLRYHGSEFELLELFRIPKITSLDCARNQLTRLDLSAVPNLRNLYCYDNNLESLALTQVTHLDKLDCMKNQLTGLDLSQVPNLTDLECRDNQLTELDLSQVPNLTTLCCYDNNLTELDIRNLRNLENLDYDKDKTRLIQRPDQNF